jgi:hypothetical protein
MTKKQLTLLCVLSVAAVVVCFFVEPIRQDPDYHCFADVTSWLSIPNFWNVVSNLPFVLVGIIGLTKVWSTNRTVLRPNYAWFFAGIFLTGFGSGYYHWHPDNATLVWDRLPMTISFMSFLSVIIGEFIGSDAGKKLLYPLLALGMASIAVWVVTEDLRMYALVQFLPIALVLIILLLSKKALSYKKYFWLMVVFYATAKFLEGYDAPIYNLTFRTMGGHALKHLAAAAAPFVFFKFVNTKSKTER